MRTALEVAPPRADSAASVAQAVSPRPSLRSLRCACGQPVSFRHDRCPACARALGFDPDSGRLLTLEPAGAEGAWAEAGGSGSWWRCARHDSPAGCNWLVPGDALPARPLCRACRLDRTLPDLRRKQHRLWWRRIEIAKRRLVAALLGLGLPVASRVDEDPVSGLAFDLLHEDDARPRVVGGYRDGIITVNIEEADDARRQRVRAALREPYRSLLGQLRHDVGLYYWDRLVAGSAWHAPFRALFGDERRAAVDPPLHASGEWAARHVSAHAAVHPLEDWAECFAHYLHMVDAIDAGAACGLDGRLVELRYEPFGEGSLLPQADADDAELLAMVNRWMELTAVLNELARSMGQPDFYPFVLSSEAVSKLDFVHRVVRSAGRASRQPTGGGIAGGSCTGNGISSGGGS